MLRKIILLVSIVLSACGAVPEDTPAAEPFGTPTKPSDADCSSPSNWTIEYQRSGGIGGFSQSITLQSDGSMTIQSDHPAVDKQLQVPADHVEPVENLLVEACPFPVGRADGNCADCFNYELEIQMDEQFYSIQAQDTTLTEELHSLVNALDEFILMAAQ
jgi:hypothetical protein